MVLVDTSVWIRFLANRAPWASQLDSLLADNDVIGHAFVYGELLVGDRGDRQKLLDAYNGMHQAAVVADREVVAFARDRGLNGRGVGWVDVHLLAAALVADVRLWTADARLSVVARELGIGYAVTR